MDQSPSIKIVFIGDTRVGKSSLIKREIEDTFEKNQTPTIGSCYFEKDYDVDGNLYKLQIWDTAGQEKFKSLVPLYFRDAFCAIIVFAVDDKSSFDGIDKWTETLQASTGMVPYVVLVGSKIDIQTRVVTSQEAEAKARALGCDYMETSSLTGEGVSDLFNFLARKASEFYGQDLNINRKYPELQMNDNTNKTCCN
ncbi:small GTP-binding protein [Histomonas meleagridis]|uniref:small GTP-binding protein n=1 Tax=Histomonas meleagridis TaxID=135588 RepID=UPI00355AB4DB|nr:small GTP-binding protein [Histomonas meleagridis]KAH0806103.1 small GTP-binding protein [Histomonas meleagridis]